MHFWSFQFLPKNDKKNTSHTSKNEFNDYSLPSFWAKLGYSRIKIDHYAYSLLKLQIKIGVHLTNVELTQLLTLGMAATAAAWAA